MQGDITRSTFDPKKGYTSVRMQQGRLQLDADWNEQADIQNHLRRAQVVDMIGAGSGASKVDPVTGEFSEKSFQLFKIFTPPTYKQELETFEVPKLSAGEKDLVYVVKDRNEYYINLYARSGKTIINNQPVLNDDLRESLDNIDFENPNADDQLLSAVIPDSQDIAPLKLEDLALVFLDLSGLLPEISENSTVHVAKLQGYYHLRVINADGEMVVDDALVLSASLRQALDVAFRDSSPDDLEKNRLLSKIISSDIISKVASPEATDIALLPGHFYANGVLCELAPGSLFTAEKTSDAISKNDQLQISPSLTIDGRRLQVGDWLVSGNAGDLGASQTALIGWRISEIVDESTRTIRLAGDLDQLGSSTAMQRVVTFTSQPDLPVTPDENRSNFATQAKRCFAYLDVWQRHITVVDDPTIREVALSVPDTTTRTKTVWQLKLRPFQSDLSQPPAASPDAPPEEWQQFLQQNQNRVPRLKACARLCPDGNTVTSGAANSRLGNFLYRVEIHAGNDTESIAHSDDLRESNSDQPRPVTFKWSRNNGSVVSPVRTIEGSVIRIPKSSQDAWADSRPDQWLELLTEAQELRGESGILVPLKSATDTKIEFDAARIIGGSIPENVAKVRRWDHTVVDAPQGAIPIQSELVELENGIKVAFEVFNSQNQENGDATNEKSPVIYKTGDYWLIPSRAATNDIEWPSDRADEDVINKANFVSKPLFQPPQGIEHRYALLAIVDIDKNNRIEQVYDLRILFPPLLRALDRAGGTVTGDLTVQQTLTTQDLNVEGDFAVQQFQAASYEVLRDPTGANPISYGAIQASPAAEPQQIQFVAENNTNFAFRNGSVSIGQVNNQQNLDVAGTVKGLQILQNQQPVALQRDLTTHVNAQNNPHRVTAEQVDTQGGNNQIVNQINAGNSTIDASRISADIARVNALNDHIGDAENPHRVTAEQIDQQGGDNQIVNQINAGAGSDTINAERISVDIVRANALNAHTGNRDNPHQVTAEQIDQQGGSDRIVTQINAGSGIIDAERISTEIARIGEVETLVNNAAGSSANALSLNGGSVNGQVGIGTDSIPDLDPPASLYVRGNLYIDAESPTGEEPPTGGKIFAKHAELENVQSEGFVQVSSGVLKNDITDLTGSEVSNLLGQLRPVKFCYKHDPENHICAGFIAEQMPDLLTNSDHSGVKIMDVVAILTKTAQDNRKIIKQLAAKIKQQSQEIEQLKQSFQDLNSPDP